jgi:hypothetical protein
MRDHEIAHNHHANSTTTDQTHPLNNHHHDDNEDDIPHNHTNANETPNPFQYTALAGEPLNEDKDDNTTRLYFQNIQF